MSSSGTHWLARVGATFHDLSVKARAPSPGQLAPLPPQMTSFPLTFPGWDKYQPQGLNAQNARDEQHARTAIQSAWVYRNINAIAQEVSTATLQMQTLAAAGDEDIEQHPLELLWEQPNPHMGRSFLMQYWTWQLLLSGEAYLFLAPRGGEIGEIWPVPSWYMVPVPDAKDFINGYLFQAPGQPNPIRIDPRYVVYSRLPNPFDIRRGLSPLAALMVEISGDLAMARWNTGFFSKDNAAPTGIIAVPRDTLDNDLARIRSEIQDFFGNGQRRVGIARAGDLAWTPFDRSQKDMEFLAGRQFTSKLIDTVFGVPEGYWSKDATRANSEGAKATMIENAVWPKLVLLAEDMNAQLLPHWYPGGLRATFDDIRPRNRQLELEELKTYQAFVTVNELRKRIDLDDLEDARGTLFVAEIGKGPTETRTAEDMEQAAAATDPAAVDSLPPAELPEDGPTTAQEAPGATGDDTAMAEAAPDDAAAKADMKRWETKALKALKAGKAAAVPFSSVAIPADTAARITEALEAAADTAAVKAAFGDTDALIDAVWAGALAWAEQARERE